MGFSWCLLPFPWKLISAVVSFSLLNYGITLCGAPSSVLLLLKTKWVHEGFLVHFFWLSLENCCLYHKVSLRWIEHAISGSWRALGAVKSTSVIFLFCLHQCWPSPTCSAHFALSSDIYKQWMAWVYQWKEVPYLQSLDAGENLWYWGRRQGKCY